MTGIASSPDLKSHIRADWKQAHNIWKNVVLSGFVEVALIPSGGGGTIILKSDGKTLQWTKIGRQITVTGNIWVDDVLEGPTGHLDITGLPGPVGEGYSYYSAVSLYGRNLEWGTDVVVLQGYVYNDGGQTKIRVSRLHQGEEHELFAHEIIAGSQLRISATYFLEGVSSDTFGFTGIASGVAHDLLSPRHGDTVPGAVVKGALPYGNATPKWAALAPNATATKKYLSMTSSVPTWEELAAGDIPAHQLDGAKHTVSGLTPGHFLKALTATTFGFAAHGLTYSDVGAAAAGHDHSGVYEPVISAGSSAQYYRGDKTWQTLNQAAIPELTTASGPSFAHLHLADLAAIYTAAESWIGPSATAGIYFKAGNVGIGTTGPGAQLDVVSSDAKVQLNAGLITGGANGGSFQINAGSWSNSNIVINPLGTGALYLNYVSGTGGIYFGNGAERTTGVIQSNGNVGIGTTVFGTAAEKVLALGTGVAPTTFPVDCFQMASIDIMAGEAAPHFWTEHGDLIRLYRQAHIADATDAADVITRANAILAAMENIGFLATV